MGDHVGIFICIILMNADLLVIIINIVIAHCGKEEEKEDS